MKPLQNFHLNRFLHFFTLEHHQHLINQRHIDRSLRVSNLLRTEIRNPWKNSLIQWKPTLIFP